MVPISWGVMVCVALICVVSFMAVPSCGVILASFVPILITIPQNFGVNKKVLRILLKPQKGVCRNLGILPNRKLRSGFWLLDHSAPVHDKFHVRKG